MIVEPNDACASTVSGHTNFAFVGVFYGAIVSAYLIYRTPVSSLKIYIVVLFQLFNLGYAMFVGISRIRDSKHLVADVIGGALIALLTSMFFAGAYIVVSERKRQTFRPDRAPESVLV